MKVRYGRMFVPRLTHRPIRKRPGRIAQYTRNRSCSLRVVQIDIAKVRQTCAPLRLYVGLLVHELTHWRQDVHGRVLCEDEASRWEYRWFRVTGMPTSLGNGWVLAHRKEGGIG